MNEERIHKPASEIIQRFLESRDNLEGPPEIGDGESWQNPYARPLLELADSLRINRVSETGNNRGKIIDLGDGWSVVYKSPHHPGGLVRGPQKTYLCGNGHNILLSVHTSEKQSWVLNWGMVSRFLKKE